MNKRLILASGSPRRQSLLRALGVDFDVITSDAHEPNTGDSPAEIVINNAVIKRDDVGARLDQPAIIIAADTLVFHHEHVLPKPADFDDARRMLRMLAGHTHEVVTGLALCDTETGTRIEGAETTHVTFRDLSDEEIDRFVYVVEPLDRAGAYTVDGPGSLIVQRYEGCYQNVLGFPMVRLDTLLRQLGVYLFDSMDKDRAVFL
ncbi:MAG: septum formation protein Maf [Candidatus Hydrogenedentes bacterium]|nr:septum formation protein Maf [Candidatus Hydrogenedentota bacterium]